MHVDNFTLQQLLGEVFKKLTCYEAKNSAELRLDFLLPNN